MPQAPAPHATSDTTIISPDDLAGSAARILVARRLSGEQGPRLPAACRPGDLDAALAIQAAVTAQLGAPIGAWKCAMPAVDRVVLAPIYGDTIHAELPCPAWSHAGQIHVEPELAFILGCDLPARDVPYLPAEVDAAIARTHLALELIDSRYTEPTDISFAEKLADGLVNQGLFIGPQVDNEVARATEQMKISICATGAEDVHLDGRHPSGAPRAPLYWLVEFLRSKGQGMLAGQAVITGSFAGSFNLPVDNDLTIQYGELGLLTVRFKAK